MTGIKLTVSQVAQEIGENVHTVRNWIRDFRPYLALEKTASGYNLFTQESLNVILKIKKMYREQSLSTKQIVAVLSGADKPSIPDKVEHFDMMRELLEEQKRFNQELIERMDEQTKRRDQQLMLVLNEIREQRKQLQTRKKRWKFWSKH